MKPVNFYLSNGFEIVVRGIEPGDKEHLAEGIKKLSEQSTYYRFNTYSPFLKDGQLNYLTRVDQSEHVALVAIHDREVDEQQGIGVGRYIRRQSNPQEAELALAVLDAYHQMGVGVLLLTSLCKIACDQGVNTFVMQVHASRYQLIRKLVDWGAQVEQQSAGICELTLSVSRFVDWVIDADQNLSQAFYMFNS